MCLRFIFLLITRLAAWLRLSQRKETWKTAEILILRHQLAVAPPEPELGGPGPVRGTLGVTLHPTGNGPRSRPAT